MSEVRTGLVGRIEKLAEHSRRVFGGPHLRIGKYELAICLVKATVGDPSGAIAPHFRVDVAVEEGLRGRHSARPEAGAADLMAVRLAGDSVGKARHTARMF